MARFLHSTLAMKKVAIIDDEPSQRLILKGLLEDIGYDVVSQGTDGKEALRICVETRPDVLIMDVKMAEKDGIEAAKEVNKFYPVAIVLLTAGEDEETIKGAARAGVMAYLIKPVEREELFAAVEMAFARFKDCERLRKENCGLKESIQSRNLIEKAKGLLMEREKPEAFSRIRKISMDRRKPMEEAAEVITLAFDKKAGSAIRKR